MDIAFFLHEYLVQRPLFLSLIRAKEAELYQKYLPFKGPVLDFGVGDGFFAKVTFDYESHPEVSDSEVEGSPTKSGEILRQAQDDQIDVGLDLEGSRIDEARDLGIYKKLVTYDGGEIPYPSRFFQTVISNCVLEHISDLDLTIKEIHRVLRPGGTFITTVMAKSWEDNLFGAKILGNTYKKWMREKQIHKNLLTRGEWDQIFEDVEFKITKKEGYLSPSACSLIDICHYLSVPSLISYKIFGKWVLFPGLAKFIYPVDYFVKILSQKVSPDKSGAIFYVLSKS